MARTKSTTKAVKKAAKVQAMKRNTEREKAKEPTKINMEMVAKKLQEEFELARQDPNKFVYFPKLPIELRLKIFKSARPEPRFIKLEKSQPRKVGKGRISSIFAVVKVPSLLQVNRESREVALKWYKLSFGGSSSKVYFDPTADGVLVQCRCYNFMHCECGSYGYELRVFDDIDKVQRVMWEGPLSNHPGYRVNYTLPWVKEIIFIAADIKDRNMVAELKKSELIESPKPSVLQEDCFDRYTARIFTAILNPANTKERPTSLEKISRMTFREGFGG